AGGPGAEMDGGDAGFGVHAEARTGPTEGVEFTLIEPSGEHERGEQPERRVPLRQHDPISIVLVGPPSQHGAVERGEDLRNRQGRTDVADIGTIRVLDHKAPDVSRQRRAGCPRGEIATRSNHRLRAPSPRSRPPRSPTTAAAIAFPRE